MKSKLQVTIIHGVPHEYFNEFKELSLEVEVYEPGPKNSLSDDIINYIIVSTLVFPYDFVRDVLKDNTKELFKLLAFKIYELWAKFKILGRSYYMEATLIL